MTNGNVICIGAALVDETYQFREQPLSGTSNPSSYFRSAGGVARNIAHHLSVLGNRTFLITVFGNDTEGEWLKNQCKSSGIQIKESKTGLHPTGRFAALLTPGGELFAGASVSAIEEEISISFLEEKKDFLAGAKLIVCDCNLAKETLHWIIRFAEKHLLNLVIEPVSVSKSQRLQGADLNSILLLTPNMAEAEAITGIKGEQSAQALLEKGVKNVWLRLGANGSVFLNKKTVRHLPPPVSGIVDTTGAGDAALAGWIHGWLAGKNINECLRYGQACASVVLQTKGAATTQDELLTELEKIK